MATFQPLRDQILIEPLDKPLSSIIIVQNNHTARGKIIATGPGSFNKHGQRNPLDVHPGDIVQVGDDNWLKFPSIELDGRTHLVIREADIVGVE